MLKITTTNLHLCQHCPRLFAYSLEGKRFAWMIGNQGTGDLKGRLFHEFAKKTQKKIISDIKKRTEIVKALKQDSNVRKVHFQEVIKTHFLIPFFTQHESSLSPENITAFASATEKWISYLFSFIEPNLLPSTQPDDLIDIVFQNEEVLISSNYRFDDGTEMNISGKPDALLFDPGTKEAVIVEYKGRKESDAIQDLAQTSIYAWLVKQSTGINPRVEILYLEEEEPLVRYDAEPINRMIENHSSLFSLARKVMNREIPVQKTQDTNLCQKCSFINRCEQDFGEPNKLDIQQKNHPDLHKKGVRIDDPARDAEQYMSALVTRLDQLNVPIIPSGYLIGPRFIRLKILPDVSKKVTFSKIVNRAIDIQIGLALSTRPLIQPQNGFISCDVPISKWTGFDVTDLCTDMRPSTQDQSLYPLGKRIDGSVMFGDLASPTMTSCLIGGTSGSGKSELLRSLVIGISLCGQPDSVSFTLIDPKRVTFTDFSSLPILHEDVILDPEVAMEALKRSVDEMEERYRDLEKAGCANIIIYNIKGSGFFQRRIIIIDEYADLIMNKTTKDALEEAIQKLGQKGRAAGFHLFLATQRPDAKVVTGIIKANLQLKIALKVTSAVNSKIILDETGAECLVGYGDMLVGGSIPMSRIQGSLVSERDIAKIL